MGVAWSGEVCQEGVVGLVGENVEVCVFTCCLGGVGDEGCGVGFGD